MLSSPPRSFAALISACVGGVEVVAVALRRSRAIVLGVDHRREAVGAEQEDVARPRRRTVKTSTSTSASVPSARVITERCGCTSASSGESSPRRTSSATSEWSSVSCSSLPVAQAVGARVADVADRDRCRRPADQRDGHRRAHARGRRVVVRALVDAAGSPP